MVRFPNGWIKPDGTFQKSLGKPGDERGEHLGVMTLEALGLDPHEWYGLITPETRRTSYFGGGRDKYSLQAGYRKVMKHGFVRVVSGNAFIGYRKDLENIKFDIITLFPGETRYEIYNENDILIGKFTKDELAETDLQEITSSQRMLEMAFRKGGGRGWWGERWRHSFAARMGRKW